MDNIDKDGLAHNYEWRLHTASTNAVNVTANPITVNGIAGSMNLHLVDPDFAGVTAAVEAYSSGSPDPPAQLIRVARDAVNPRFTFIMLPRASEAPAPSVTRQSYTWGCGATIAWGGGLSDVLVRNDSGAPVSYGGVTTDATAAVVRKQGGTVVSYLMAHGRSLAINNSSYATMNDAPGSCDYSGDTVRLSRDNADFRILDTGVQHVLYHDRDMGFVVDDGYVVPDGITAVQSPRGVTLRVSAQPNPFNPTTIIRIEAARRERATAVIYDVAGRRVRELWSGTTGIAQLLAWDGRNDDGDVVSSGTYFVRVATASQTRTLKLTLLK
jgi:hypothetical protein